MEENIQFPLPLTLQPKTAGKEERENIQDQSWEEQYFTLQASISSEQDSQDVNINHLGVLCTFQCSGIWISLSNYNAYYVSQKLQSTS